MDRRIILLDLNATLALPPASWTEPLATRLRREVYRPWLVAYCRDRYTVLVTARHQRWEEATLARLWEQTNWLPDWSLFSDDSFASPPEIKARRLERLILPSFGPDPGRYLALESNRATRAMYAGFGIEALPCQTLAAALRVDPDALDQAAGPVQMALDLGLPDPV